MLACYYCLSNFGVVVVHAVCGCGSCCCAIVCVKGRNTKFGVVFLVALCLWLTACGGIDFCFSGSGCGLDITVVWLAGVVLWWMW